MWGPALGRSSSLSCSKWDYLLVVHGSRQGIERAPQEYTWDREKESRLNEKIISGRAEKHLFIIILYIR